MEDLQRQVAAAQDTANKARAEAAEAKAEAVNARAEAAEAKTEAAKAKAEVAKVVPRAVVMTNPAPAAEVRTRHDTSGDANNAINDEGYEPPFDNVVGGSRSDNEAKENRRIKAFFRDTEKVKLNFLIDPTSCYRDYGEPA